MSVLDFYTWAENSSLGQWMRSYASLFAMVEVVHIFGITLLLGTIYTLNFRLFGFALKSRSIAEVAEGLAPWTLAGYVLTFGTGIMLFSAEALKMHDNSLWSYKLFILFTALILQLTVFRSFAKPGRAEASPIAAKLTAILSVLLWLAVGMSGRIIAFI
jgi:uncharacterized membrane protein